MTCIEVTPGAARVCQCFPMWSSVGCRWPLTFQDVCPQGMGTVLEGGEAGVDVAAMDFAGVTPRNVVAATPNPLAGMTPSVRGAGGATGARVVPSIAGVSATPSVAGTPLRAGSGGVGPGATPLIRDALGLNEADALTMEAAMSKRAAAARAAVMRGELRERLAGLPTPQNEYAFEVPELPEAEEEAEDAMEEDLADVRARKAREEAERRRIEELKKSKVRAGFELVMAGLFPPFPRE